MAKLSPDAPFRQYKTTDEEIVMDGYKTGLTWPSDRWKHKPGGPYVAEVRNCTDPDWIEYCNKLKRHNELWRTAWESGLAAQAMACQDAKNLLTNIIVEKIMA